MAFPRTLKASKASTSLKMAFLFAVMLPMANFRFDLSWLFFSAFLTLVLKSKCVVPSVLSIDALPYELGKVPAGDRYLPVRHGPGNVHEAAAIA